MSARDSFDVVTALRRARLASGLTQVDVASRAGTDTQRISEWENGHRRPHMDALCLWANALGGKIVLQFDGEAK